METPQDRRRAYSRAWTAAGKRHHCSRCRKETPGSKSPYCKECWKAYLHERTEKRRAERKCTCGNPVMVVNKHAIKLCAECRQQKLTAQIENRLVTCEECGARHFRRCQWNCLCADCSAKAKAAKVKPPKLCACGVVLENRRHKQCAACKAPKEQLVPMTCQECGRVEVSARNMVRCASCRREKERLFQAERERKRTERRRLERKCECGKPAAVSEKGVLGEYCEECRKESLRLQDREKEHRRRARKRGGTAGPASIRTLWREFGGVCPLCEAAVTRANGHVDHIIPLAKGGSHTQENLQILCGPCNVKKGAALPRTSTGIPAHCTAGDNPATPSAVVE